MTNGSDLAPTQKAFIHNQALPAIGNNFLTTDITPTNTPTMFRIMVGISIAGVLSTAITNGGDTQVLSFNSGVALGIDNLHVFEILVHSGDSINFRLSTTTGIIRVLRVQEIFPATA